MNAALSPTEQSPAGNNAPRVRPAGRAEFAAPGRVNLIGEHTDYSGGLVLPMAIPFATVATIEPSGDERHHLSSTSFPTFRDLAPNDRSGRVGDWSDYPVGVLRQLQAMRIHPAPFRLHLRGDVPLGAGLSSSASVEVATAMALLHHAGATCTVREIATLCQRAENEYVGSPCGIMDQFVITAATGGHALLIDTASLSYESLPMNQGALAECSVVVANSMVKHSVAEGDYGLRRREMEAGQAVLRAGFPSVRDLGMATLAQLEARASAMPAASLRRCRHVIQENERVRRARKTMLSGDAAALGKLLIEAHTSFRDDFESSCEEIDFLVQTAVALPGCYGARITGGGFGGCTVNLVRNASIESFTDALQIAYRQRFAIDAEVYICTATDGAVARAASHNAGPGRSI